MLTEADYLTTAQRSGATLIPATDLRPGDQLFRLSLEPQVVDRTEDTEDWDGFRVWVVGQKLPERCSPLDRVYVIA